MAKRNGSSTLSENVTKTLRSDILAGRYEPGSPLIVSELAKRFEVSIAVIREALTRLAPQGLISQNPNQGFSVKTASGQELNSIIEARLLNESAALRLSIAHGDLSWESNIISIHHKLSQTPEYEEVNEKKVVSETWSDLHRQFHYELIAACPNPVLLDICGRLWDLSEFYRHYLPAQPFARDGRAEHKALADAVISRDPDRAVEIFQAHIQLTAELLFDRQ